jgi:rubrerythrin
MTDTPFEMTKLQKLEKAVLLLEEQVATNKEMNENYQKELEEAKKELKDYNKPELTPAQLDDVHNAIENAVNDFNFEDEGMYDKEFELDYDGRVALSHISINCTYELVETIVERVHNLFKEIKDDK